jgi:hypothetical protein
MEKKVCTKCKEEKELTEFPKGRTKCKLCLKEYQKLYSEKNKERLYLHKKEYREKNKEKNRLKTNEYSKLYYSKNYKEKRKLYLEKNKEIIKDKKKEYDKIYTEKNKEILSIKNKEYREKHKERLQGYRRQRYNQNTIYKLTNSIRNRINVTLKKNGYTKKSKTYKILGCTYEEFKLYMESQWEEWMNWNNYGLCDHKTKNYGWDLDHIIPLSSGKCEEDIIKLNHHSNIQPLCSYINRYVKRDKII